MEASEIQNALAPIMERVRQDSFGDRVGATADEHVLGVIVSTFFKWDGAAILEVTRAALEDANFPPEAERVRKMVDAVLA